MFKALKNVSKSVLILIIGIICLPIVILILVAILQSCSNSSSYSGYENKMVSAARKYFNAKDLNPTSSNAEMVTLDTLVAEGYIKSPEKSLKDSTCEGMVYSRKNGVVPDLDLEGSIVYSVVLKCDKYNTNTLLNNIMEDLTTSGSGLYEDGNYYVYKGDTVKNYVKFYGSTYRIIDLDKSGVARLVKTSNESNTRAWDNKYNVEVNYSYGKSIYNDSLIKKNILKDYTNTKKVSLAARSHIVSHDICVGKRSKNDISISRDLDCNDILSNQVLGLLNVSDFARASTDPDCKTIEDRVCKNYNYLNNVASNTWTLNGIIDNSYQVYYLSSGVARVYNASEYNSYSLVIHIDANEIVKSGTGTESSPYIIG